MMDAGEIKQIIADIRQAIKDDNTPLVIKKCQRILAENSEHYMALVFLGAAYQKSDPTQAAVYLHKAVKCSPKPTLALKGLVSCTPVDELPQIYEQLFDVNPENLTTYVEKMTVIALTNPHIIPNCIQIYKKTLQNGKCTTDTREVLLWNLARLLFTGNNDVDEPDLELLRSCLEVAMKHKDDVLFHLKCCKNYLKVLFKLGDYATLLKNSEELVELYPKQVFPLEWICKVYCETYKINVSHISNLMLPITFYINALQEMNPNNTLIMLIQAIEKLEQKHFMEAKDLLNKVQELFPNYRITLQLLVQAEMTVGAYNEAMKYLRSMGQKSENLGVCLSHSEKSEDLEEAVEILKDLEQNETVIDALARCYSNLGEADKLQKLPLTPLLRVRYILSSQEALEVLNGMENQDSFEIIFEKARHYAKLENYDSALMCMLNATRLRPYQIQCFLLLSEIYTNLDDRTRAKKCLQKYIRLNQTCEKGVTLLSAMYHEDEEEELNGSLLLSTKERISGATPLWIIFRLGQHYLAARSFAKAIASFRTLVEAEPTKTIYWEHLGDSYSHRGSHLTASKMFLKVIELDPDNVHAKLQLGNSRTAMHEYRDAIKGLTELVAEKPDFVAGLKALAEGHIGLAKELRRERRLGRSKEHFQKAVNLLQKVLANPQNASVWLYRLIATTFVQVAKLPTSKAHLEVSGELAKRSEEHVVLSRREMLDIATGLYLTVLKDRNDVHVWYELALCGYWNAKYHPENEVELIEFAIEACKNAVQLKETNWKNWNLLGIMHMHKAVNNMGYAQHCFIMALDLYPRSWVLWVNLGVLYLKVDDKELATKAFQQAQKANIFYLNVWICLAIIAESIGDDIEALSLYGHSHQFGDNLVAASGIAGVVCVILNDEEKRNNKKCDVNINTFHGDIVALDSINWYAAMKEDKCDPESFSCQAFLNCYQGMWGSAIIGYSKAAKVAENDNRDHLYTNLGYVYLKNNQPKEAIEAFKNVSNSDFNSIVGLALAYFRAEQYQESYAVYSSILKTIAEHNDKNTAQILVAMASMVYSFQGEEDTKTLLYQCILMPDHPIEALYAACALGILHNDVQLTETVLEELQVYEQSIQHCHHIAFLRSQYYVANNNAKKGLSYLAHCVRKFPQSIELRSILANYLLENFNENEKYVFPSSQIALSAIVLGHSSKKKSVSKDDAKSLLTLSRTLWKLEPRRSLKLVQKAIHLHPQCEGVWSDLASLRQNLVD